MYRPTQYLGNDSKHQNKEELYETHIYDSNVCIHTRMSLNKLTNFSGGCNTNIPENIFKMK